MERNKKKVVLDQAHSCGVEIETSAYSEFITFLFENFVVGKITKTISEEVLEKFDLLIIGNPNSKYSEEEIAAILKFLEEGGRLLIISDEGGDLSNGTNLNKLTVHLGFINQPDIIFDRENYVDKIVWPVITKFAPHPITADINTLVVASGCTFKILPPDKLPHNDNVTVKPLVYGGFTSKIKIYDMTLRKWVEQSGNNEVISLAGIYKKGRFCALPTPSLISSLNNRYGWQAKDNSLFVINILKWLTEDTDVTYMVADLGRQIETTIRLDKDIYNWLTSASISNGLGDLSAVINFALRRLKKELERPVETEQIERELSEPEAKEELPKT